MLHRMIDIGVNNRRAKFQNEKLRKNFGPKTGFGPREVSEKKIKKKKFHSSKQNRKTPQES